MASRVTSGPMPSPARTAILSFMRDSFELRGSRRQIGRYAKRDTDASSRSVRWRQVQRRCVGCEQGEEVLVVDGFLAVGELGEAGVDLVELGPGERVAEFGEAMLEGAAAGVFAENDVVGGDADGLGRHDLVGERVGEHAVLVDAGLVREGVGADDGLVGRAAEADDLGQHLAGGVELRHDDVGGVGSLSRRTMRAAAISSRAALPARSPMPLMVHSTWRAPPSMPARVLATAMPRSSWQWVERMMSSHAGDARANSAEDGGVFVGRGVADGVGDVDGGGAGLDGDCDHLDEEVGVGAGGVFGGELDVVGEGAGEADGLGGLVERLVAGDLELGFEMEVGGGEEDVDAVAGGGLDGAGGGFDVLALAAGERGDARAADLAGDGADGVGVAVGGDGEAGLDDVDAKAWRAGGPCAAFRRGAWCSRGTARRRGGWCRRRRSGWIAGIGGFTGTATSVWTLS